MRQIILAAFLASVAPTAFAQIHDLPSPEAVVINAMHPGNEVPHNTGMTELQREAERVEAYRRAYGLSNANPAPIMPPSAQLPAQSRSTTRMPVAPNGIENISLYNTPAAASVHTVVKGDTLYNISNRYGVELTKLRRINQISGSQIQLGQTLMLPAKKTASTQGHSLPAPDVRRVNESTASTVTNNNNTRLAADPEQRRLIRYAVAPGDTIAAIARRTCVSENQLINENNLGNPDSLRPGHMLSLPDDHCLAR